MSTAGAVADDQDDELGVFDRRDADERTVHVCGGVAALDRLVRRTGLAAGVVAGDLHAAAAAVDDVVFHDIEHIVSGLLGDALASDLRFERHHRVSV